MTDLYDVLPYPTRAEVRLHIENLRTRAALNGFTAAPPEAARVLEIGCGNGFNLAPMAECYPGATFIGLDLCNSAIELGTRLAGEANLRNLELRCLDLQQVDPAAMSSEFGTFDYVIAHGVYSWVPEDVREAVWRLAQAVLSPNGIFYLSYNALPGWYAAQIARDFIGFIHRDGASREDTLHRAWDAFGVFSACTEEHHPLVEEASRIRNRPQSVLAHDEWNECCQPYYLSEVLERAKQYGLRYVGEAGVLLPTDLSRHGSVAANIAELGSGDPQLQLQLLDFTAMRRFHDSLFARETNQPTTHQRANMLLDCWARSDIRYTETAAGGARVYTHSGGVRLTSSHPLMCALADALEAAAPGAVHLGEFRADRNQGRLPANPLQTVEFGHLILRMFEGAALRLWMMPAPMARKVSDRPEARAFARQQVAYEGLAADAYHACTAVTEPWKRTLFCLLDGTRTHEQLADELATSDVPLPDGANCNLPEGREADRLTFFRRHVPEALEGFRRNAILFR